MDLIRAKKRKRAKANYIGCIRCGNVFAFSLHDLVSNVAYAYAVKPTGNGLAWDESKRQYKKELSLLCPICFHLPLGLPYALSEVTEAEARNYLNGITAGTHRTA